MKIFILDAAAQDLREGREFYEAQRPALGANFIDTLFSDIESLQLHAGIHRVFFGEYHRLLSRRFPFAIYYTRSGESVYVHAVLDCRRRPSWIRKRLE